MEKNYEPIEENFSKTITPESYKSMYYSLFNKLTDLSDEILRMQEIVEEQYIDQTYRYPPLVLLSKDEFSSKEQPFSWSSPIEITGLYFILELSKKEFLKKYPQVNLEACIAYSKITFQSEGMQDLKKKVIQWMKLNYEKNSTCHFLFKTELDMAYEKLFSGK